MTHLSRGPVNRSLDLADTHKPRPGLCCRLKPLSEATTSGLTHTRCCLLFCFCVEPQPCSHCLRPSELMAWHRLGGGGVSDLGGNSVQVKVWRSGAWWPLTCYVCWVCLRACGESVVRAVSVGETRTDITGSNVHCCVGGTRTHGREDADRKGKKGRRQKIDSCGPAPKMLSIVGPRVPFFGWMSLGSRS